MIAYRYARDAIWLPINVGKHRLLFRAEAVRKERTGIHARVEIWLSTEGGEKTRLTYDQFNVERQEERRRLMKGAYALLPAEAKELITLDQSILELDAFCGDLWAAQVGTIEGEWVEGDINLPPPRMLGPYLVEGGGTILFGPPGKGKSWMLHLIAQSMQHGARKVWPIQEGANVLFINLERDDALVRQRIGSVNRALGLPGNAGMHLLSRRGYSLKDVWDSAYKYVRDNNIEVVALDSLTRAGAGDLNQNSVANEVVDMMNRLSRSWIGIAHQKWTGDDDKMEAHAFGSVMFRAGCDMEVGLASEQRDGGDIDMRLEVVKNNVRITDRVAFMRLCMDHLGLLNVEEGRRFTPNAPQAERQVLDMLEELGLACPEELADLLGFEVRDVKRICDQHEGIVFSHLSETRARMFKIRR